MMRCFWGATLTVELLLTVLQFQGGDAVNVYDPLHARELKEMKKSGATGMSGGHACGLSHSDDLHSSDSPPAVRPQRYPRRVIENVNPETGRRELSDSFMPIDEAEEKGLTDNIRIRVVYDIIEGGDKADDDDNPKQCNFVGETIDISEGNGNYNKEWSGCDAEHIPYPNEDLSGDVKREAERRYAVLKERTEWAARYWEQVLRVKPVEDEIIVDLDGISNMPAELISEKSKNQTDADLVMIMTARPEPERAVAGFASCLQTDDHRRCTVGQFNWTPELFKVNDRFADNVKRGERHTAAHEVAHLLGAIFVGNTRFHIDEDGNQKDFDDVAVNEEASDHYTKTVTKVKTERVLEVARKHFDCEDLDGVELEDVPLGAKAHWESRILGPEFLSYGGAAGEVFVSDLTLAFLEDTNQYVANYSYAGLLVEPTEVSFRISGPGFLTASGVKREDPPSPRSPGSLTWGRGEGCDFVKGSAREWPSRYRCMKHQEHGCTADNKNSAVCSLVFDWKIPKTFSYYENGENEVEDCDTSSDCPLPEMFRYFEEDELSSAASNADISVDDIELERVGGFSDSMDHVPIQVRFWNCRDQKAATNGSARDEGEGGGLSLGDLVGGILPDMDKFGGQQHCANCRCFVSSLRELTSFAFDPRFPRFGLCYRANCFREDYLQVGVRNQLGGMSWYKCPRGGGRLHIAGFTGSLHCPEAKGFCQFEEISGIRYPETDPMFEIIFFSVIGGILLILGCICCGPNWRDKMVRKCKRWCGVTQFYQMSQYKDGTLDPSPHVPDHTSGVIMLVLNTLLTGIGLSLVGLAIYGIVESIISSAAIPMLLWGCMLFTISVMGMISSRKPSRGPSCCAAVFYYISFGAVLISLLFIGIFVIFPSYLEFHVESNINVYSDMFPSIVDEDDDDAKNAKRVADMFQDHRLMIIGVLIGFCILYICNLVLLTRIMWCPTVVAMNYTALNNASWIVGLVATVIGILFAVFQGTFAGEEALPIIIIFVGSVAFATGIIGIIGAFRKNMFFVVLNMILVTVVTALLVGGIVISVLEAKDIDETVENMSEKRKREISEDLGFATLDDEELEKELRANFRTMAMIFIITTIAFVVLFFMTFFYVKYMRQYKEQEPKGRDSKLHSITNVEPKDSKSKSKRAQSIEDQQERDRERKHQPVSID